MIKREDGRFENVSGRIFETKEDYDIWWKEVCKEECEKYRISDNLSEEELEFLKSDADYRRGYSQGFYAARNNPDITCGEVNKWRHSNDLSAPPGSPCKINMFIKK